MPDEPTPNGAEEPTSDGEHRREPAPATRNSRVIISETLTPVRERVPSDHSARRLLALVVVITMCAATIILEGALVVRGADPADIVAGLTPLTALATAVVTFYFTRER